MNQRYIASVVICTHNRPEYLVKALNGLVKQSTDLNTFEIIVIDNCSTDNTKEIVEQFQSKLPNLNYFFENKLGLSVARNRGLKETAGKYIAYLDDDAIPDKDWLRYVFEGFAQGRENVSLLGGKVLPLWEIPRPNWLSDEFLPYLTVVDLGDEIITIDDTSGVVGANMVFKTSVLQELGGFPTQLGRKGSNLLSNEEHVLKLKLQEAGYGAMYHPKAMVLHHAPRERVSKHWFKRRLYWQGESDAVWWRMHNKLSIGQIFIKVGKSVSKMLKEFFNILLCISDNNEQKKIRPQLNFLYHLGYMLGISKWNIHE
jgi:glycosyltransferase involved in cell wall biosynthesis